MYSGNLQKSVDCSVWKCDAVGMGWLCFLCGRAVAIFIKLQIAPRAQGSLELGTRLEKRTRQWDKKAKCTQKTLCGHPEGRVNLGLFLNIWKQRDALWEGLRRVLGNHPVVGERSCYHSTLS